MIIDNQEPSLPGEEQPGNEVFATNISKDPFDGSNILHHLYKQLGYRVEARDVPDQPDAFAQHTDTSETRDALMSINDELLEYPVYMGFIYPISNGDSISLWPLTQSVEKARQVLDLPSPAENFQRGVTDAGVLQIAQRGYRTALEKGLEATQIFASMPHNQAIAEVLENNPEYKIRQSELAAYEEAKVDPLSPEDLGGLLLPGVQKILRNHPEWKPKPKSPGPGKRPNATS